MAMVLVFSPEQLEKVLERDESLIIHW